MWTILPAAAAHLCRWFPQHLFYYDLVPQSLRQVCCFRPHLDHQSVERRTIQKFNHPSVNNTTQAQTNIVKIQFHLTDIVMQDGHNSITKQRDTLWCNIFEHGAKRGKFGKSVIARFKS